MRLLITMLAMNIVLLLLPAIVYSKISIDVLPDQTRDESDVSFSGEDRSPVSDHERKAFHITDDSLKKAIEKYNGKRCTDVYLKSPTPHGDVYSKYNWQPVERVLRPVRARIIGINTKPVAVSTAEYVNKYDIIDNVYLTAETPPVEETVSHAWRSGGDLIVGQEINYDVMFGAEILSYSASWGEASTKTRSVILGTIINVQTTVPPRATILVSITAAQGTMEIEIDYEATLEGDVVCNYEKPYDGHNFWSFPINGLQYAGDLPGTVPATESLKIGFYSNVKMVINNGTTNDEIPAGILRVID